MICEATQVINDAAVTQRVSCLVHLHGHVSVAEVLAAAKTLPRSQSVPPAEVSFVFGHGAGCSTSGAHRKSPYRGTFRNVRDLAQRIDTFVKRYNAHAQPFTWTATADSILQKLQRLCEVIHGTRD
jgi:hypothetical protein